MEGEDMNAKKLDLIRRKNGIPCIIASAADAAAMAAAIKRASDAADIAAAWKEAAKATLEAAINDGSALEDDDASATGRVYKAAAVFGPWAVVETVTETHSFNSAAAKELLTPEQVDQCTRYGTRTVYTAEQVA